MKGNVKNKIFPNFSTEMDEFGTKRVIGTFSIIDSNKYARSMEDSKKNFGKFGYSKKPLTSIEHQDACVDLLHLFLRVTDKLVNLFLMKICSIGKILN